MNNWKVNYENRLVPFHNSQTTEPKILKKYKIVSLGTEGYVDFQTPQFLWDI